MVKSFESQVNRQFKPIASSENLDFTLSDGLVCKKVKLEEPKRKDLFLSCSCESEIVRLSKWEDEDEVYLTVYSFLSDKYSFWERLKILFCGKTKSTEIILSKKEFNKLKKF
jgi:hypothetical protein